ncbi:MAG TPA: membrane protein insertase YidC [Candidatus Aminicenantes bacterium]|jgi:YidC/Oxa1 family membrane protein insertase|nr:membrane protein insertase YidC [Candidatus Aminicenantes bacterium]HNT31223.1 membrane protein insertase YidC [Candidatus Aminicenantes bacterium]HOF82583.1 membrane protein insertase YidC [Candidatus Aminicenantes bacterium]HOS10446.1 membrane protein insertase YidC [Candidatus Aminicenantes bacterium]HOY98609.1 membrane protein insertase YidC [Candidatus Aminicenantes bacterium]
METRRIILAIVLSLGVLLLWQYVFVKKAPETAPPPQPVAAQAAAPAPETETAGRPEAETAPAEERASDAAEALNAETEEEIIVSTSLYTARWTNKGGVLLSWKLHHHKNEKDEALELVPAAAEASGVQPLALLEALDPSRATIEELRSTPLNTALYEATGGNLSLKDGEKGVLRFRYADGRGLEAEKTFTFTGGRYDVGAAVTVRRGGRPADVRIVWGPGCGNPSEAELKQRFGAGAGASFLAGTKVYRVEEKKYKPESSVFNFLTWSAYDDNYFATIFLPETASGSASFLRFENGKTPFFFLAASAPRTIFIGPKEMGVLTALGSETKRVVRYGMFGFITEILFVSLRAIHKVVPNWGFAIIVLTILIKILFFPLTYSSSKSMARMADLQPKIKALRAKYKKAKTDIEQRRQMNEEMMKLYKEHGVNPAGGCLPMLIQLPIFWGFFRMLTVAIELRHSPWILWIKDLSVHDPTYVTPILMGVTQFISQKMTPTSADPAQARMMLIMPVVMTLFFLNFQSGLVLYWLTSNVLQIGQQALMNRMMQKKKVVSHGKSRKK